MIYTRQNFPFKLTIKHIKSNLIFTYYASVTEYLDIDITKFIIL